MKCSPNIIITNGRHAYVMMRSLAQKGLKVWLADTYKPGIARSKYCAGFFLTPDPYENELEYVRFLLEKIDELNPSCLLPLFDFLVLSKHKDEFAGRVNLLVENYQKVVTLEDKALFSEYVESLGVAQPERYFSSEQIGHYPVVAKLPFGRSGESVFFPSNQNELETLTKKHQNLLVTEYVEGREYSVDCLRFDGFFMASVYSSYREGKSLIRQPENNDELTSVCKKLLDSLSYDGVCGFDFIVGNDGVPYVIEANPRFTGGLGMDLMNGFDFPYWYYCRSVGQPFSCNENTAKIKTCSIWCGHKPKGVFYEDSMINDPIALAACIKERYSSFLKNTYLCRKCR